MGDDRLGYRQRETASVDDIVAWLEGGIARKVTMVYDCAEYGTQVGK